MYVKWAKERNWNKQEKTSATQQNDGRMVEQKSIQREKKTKGTKNLLNTYIFGSSGLKATFSISYEKKHLLSAKWNSS